MVTRPPDDGGASGFESRLSEQTSCVVQDFLNASVVQLAEHVVANDEVAGSYPARCSIFLREIVGTIIVFRIMNDIYWYANHHFMQLF